MTYAYSEGGVFYHADGRIAFERTIPLPPAHLRDRVHGNVDEQSFLDVGAACARDIQAALVSVGRDIAECYRVLDFGCGCGRVLRHIYDYAPDSHVWGTDVDGEAIAWCEEHMSQGLFFSKNAPLPPLPILPATVDLIYAISVFTHLDQQRQRLWLTELRRVLRPGGVVVLSLHGESIVKRELPAALPALLERGTLFAPTRRWPDMPEWYGVSAHTETGARAMADGLFTRCHYMPRALNGDHDLLVLEA